MPSSAIEPRHADVHATISDGVLTLTLDRPEQLNAVTAASLDALTYLVEQAGSDRTVSVIVIRGSGRAFCSGAALGTSGDADGDASVQTIDAANRLVAAMRDSPLPVVAAVHGPAAGVGVSIALAADLTFASTRAYFLLAFARIGLMPDGGATALVAAAVGRAKAMRMGLLAEKLSATEAEACGLVAGVWEHDDFDARLAEVLAALSDGPSVALARTKQAINAATLTHLDQAFSLEREGQLGLLAAPDFAEGSAAFAEKRTPVFTDS